MKPKGLKIIFLDFNGTIDKPYRWSTEVLDRSEVSRGPEDGAFGAGEDGGLQFGYGDGAGEPTGFVHTFAETDEVALPEETVPQDSAEDLVRAALEEARLSSPGIRKDPYGLDEEPLKIQHGYYPEEDAIHSSYGLGGRNVTGFTTYHDEPNPESIKFLKQLIEETGAKIVYSTTRRHMGWQNCANYLGLPFEYSLGDPEFAVTPTQLDPEKVSKITWFKNIPFFAKKPKTSGYSYFKPRQREIQQWLKNWTGEPIESYVILDDDIITDPQLAKHWVSSVADNRFLEAEYEQALKILQNKY